MIRIGMGYDVHRLGPGRKLMLGGVEIPHPFGLEGHSDADALLHAICDACLGAAGLGDIGQLFPDTDPVLKGADSRKLLAEVVERMHKAGWELVNLDGVVIAEAPKLATHFAAMRGVIAGIFGCPEGRIGLKAKTNEKLGYLGAKEAIAVECVALLQARGEGK